MAERRIGREILFLVLGTVVGTGGSCVLADRERSAQEREARRTAATSVFQEVGRLMDTRYYRMLRLQQSLDRRSSDSTEWQVDYDSLTQLWHERLPTNVAVLCHYLGNARARELMDISIGLSRLRGAYKGHQPVDSLREAVRRRIFRFELAVADQLRAGEVFEKKRVVVEGCSDLEPNRGPVTVPSAQRGSASPSG
jgi:hypothetical protein